MWVGLISGKVVTDVEAKSRLVALPKMESLIIVKGFISTAATFRYGAFLKRRSGRILHEIMRNWSQLTHRHTILVVPMLQGTRQT